MMGSIIYFGLALVIAFFGRKRVMRFWGTLLLGIFLTPVVSLLVLVLGSPVAEPQHKTTV